MDDRVCDGHVVLARERLPARQHLEEHDAKRPQIGARIRLAADLLGRHVRHRPEKRTGGAEALVARFRQPEVQDFHRPVREQHDVARLQVPMHDAGGVRALQPPRDLPRDVEGSAHGERPILIEARLERFPRIERHRQEQPPVFRLPHLVERAEVRMIERGDRARFPEETRPGGSIGVWFGGKELQRHHPAQARVLGAVDDAHAAGAERLQHAEVRDRAPGQAQGIERRPACEKRSFEGREPAVGVGVGPEQRLDGGAQLGVGAAQCREAIPARGGVELDERVERGPDLFPAARIHGPAQRSGSPFSSSASHARAERSSRLAVASDTPTAAALSSSDRPPK